MARSRVASWRVKAAVALYLAVLLPAYWRGYGAGNFLWLSDLALFLTAAALLLDRPALAAVAACVLPLELAWCADWISGARLLGLTGYMFDPANPLWLRALSLFHLALPPAILFLLWRHGYSRRALAWQLALVWSALLASYALTDPGMNVNWVFGPFGRTQQALPPLAWLGLELLAISLLVLLPLDVALRRVFFPPVSAA